MTTPGAIRTKAWPIDIRPRTIKDRPLNRKDKVTTGKIPHSRIQRPRDHIHTYITSITGAQKSRYVCLEGFSYEISEPTKGREKVWVMGNILNSHAARPQLPSTLRVRDVWALRWMIIHRSHSYALDDHPPLSFICVGWSSKVSLDISGYLWKSLEISGNLWKYLLLFIYEKHFCTS